MSTIRTRATNAAHSGAVPGGRGAVACVGGAAVAAALFGGAPILTTAPAQADPMIPLAPACDTYEFKGGLLQIELDNGIVAQFPAKGQRLAGPGQYAIPGKTVMTFGTASGGINGRTINITTKWTDGPGAGFSNTITGQVNNDSRASGTVINNQGTRNSWRTADTLNCVTPPAPPPPPPPPPLKTATVSSATNIFDLPDGNGTEYLDANGVPIFKAPGKVTLVEPDLCRNDWCKVVAPEVPPGVGWIFIGEGLGTYP